jgi:lipopolysaccharide/colanic/teichoic acid biosynthesis glycosyltransferase
MTDLEFDQKLVRRFTAVQTPFGRWRLKWYIQWKRWTWRFMLTSTLFIKRIFDFGISLIVVIALSPMFLLLAALIKLEDGGPVFFKQTRVGKWGREFTMYKFRSMCLDAEERLEELLARNEHLEGVTFKMKDDPRITWTGKWMRLFSLDEFPQLWNVLRGDMSLVGPRPPVPREVELYSSSDRRRLAVTPGITCFWQIAGRSEIDFSGQVALDVQYIESQSFWTDLKILFKTIPAVLTGKGAC